jgi:NADH-quinone oxidoreductase subunit M
MFGKLDNPANQNLPDMNLREIVTLAPLVVLAFWIGLYPAPFFKAMDKPVNKLVQAVVTAAATPDAPAAASLEQSPDAASPAPVLVREVQGAR